MARIDKDKLLKQAAGYQEKGQHDKAIDELRKILRVNPKDTRTLQKVAELQSKKGDKKEAIKTYTQLAELYEKDGFIDFAISVYKTILKLDSGLFNIHLKLGELFLKKNLKSEALSSLQTAFKLCSDNKMVRESIEVLEKMLEANPEDVSTIEKLADRYYYDDGKADAAKNLLHRAAEIMKNTSHIDRAEKLYERILNMDPRDELALRKVAELEAGRGGLNRAVDLYERVLESNPNDVETLRKATEVYRDLGDEEKTKLYFRRLADAYKLGNAHTALTEVYEEILSLDPFDPEAVEFMNRKNTASETDDKPPEEESELEIQNDLKDVAEIEGVSFSNESNPPGEDSKENDKELELVLDDEAQDVSREGYSILLGDEPDVSPQLELDEKSFSEVEMVDEKELEETRMRGERPDVLDISEGYLERKETRVEGPILKESTTATRGEESRTDSSKSADSVFYERGSAYKDMKMTEQAVAEFRKSIGEGYKVWESYMMIGLCFLERGDGKRALQWFRKGLTLDGLLVEHIVGLKSGSALALGAMGNFSEAIKVLEEIVEDYGKFGKN